MPVTNEPKLRVNDCLPDTDTLRSSIADSIIYTVRVFNSEWGSECSRLGEGYVIAYLKDVVNSLPDDDILDLVYVSREREPQFLAYEFCGKLTEYNDLKRKIDTIFI